MQQKAMLDDVTCSVEHGQSVLIVGESGVGKSSLLRAIVGLWTSGSGDITRKQDAESFFLPQKPYMFLGTLREQLLYPLLDNPIPNCTMIEALKEVGLEYLLEQYTLDSQQMWASTLSGGEQQRINFARLLIRDDIKFVMLDEGTSACDETSEAKLYRCLRERVRSFVSVGHRPALLEHHTHVLWLRRRGGGGESTTQLDATPSAATWKYMTVAQYKDAQLAIAVGTKFEEGRSPFDRTSCRATSVGSPRSGRSRSGSEPGDVV
eukprot:TRINITY_DN8275_c0_g1_i3.p1 TRINITY_DN8275_c0_g1~~TRINITY_DN8275_c0_g1_i3.p1  ORF type:complete len:264 (+),score=46.91 TRINITY_DN8275_c0_g1_i3:158-949(+)